MTVNVLHIWGPGYQYGFGGDFIYWKFAYQNWDQERVCHFLYDDRDGSLKPAQDLLRQGSSPRPPTPGRAARLLWALRLLWFLARRRQEYDLLHVHSLIWGGLWAAPLAKLLNKPSIYTSVLEGADNPSASPRSLLGSVSMACLRQFTQIIAISRALAADYQRHDFRVVTITNSVDLATFTPPDCAADKTRLRQALGLPAQAQVLLFVGSVKYRKGADLLIEVFTRLADARPGLYLLVVGPNSLVESASLDTHFIQSLYSRLAACGLAERVRFTGLVTDKISLAQYYQAADVFVFPTRHEGLGNVVLEAQASLLPVVVTHLPEIEDILEDQITGLFAPS